jgi:5'-nucleotidase
MQRILIDMDDVMADTSQKILNMVNDTYNSHYTKEILIADAQIREEYQEKYQPQRHRLWEKGFFRDIPLMPDAQEVVAKLYEKYEIFVVSAATEFPNSLAEKFEWLEDYFPYIGWTHTVFCGHKWMIRADYIIDDHEKNLINFQGKGLLFDAVHNKHITDFQRVNSWKDIESLLL